MMKILWKCYSILNILKPCDMYMSVNWAVVCSGNCWLLAKQQGIAWTNGDLLTKQWTFIQHTKVSSKKCGWKFHLFFLRHFQSLISTLWKNWTFPWLVLIDKKPTSKFNEVLSLLWMWACYPIILERPARYTVSQSPCTALTAGKLPALWAVQGTVSEWPL